MNEALSNKMDENNQTGIAPPQEQKTKVSVEVQTEHAIIHRRKLDLDKSIATPPSELRKEIYHLRDELTEAYEFHDLELQVLKEDYELCTGKSATDGKNINDLEKSLKDAEQIILEGNKEISILKTINQDLSKKLEEEYNKYETLKVQHEDEVSKLHIALKKKDVEIENLKKDKDDFDFRLELLNENYNRKISELKSALEKKIEKESENEKSSTYDELQRRLTEENEKTKELSKTLEDLNLELLLNKEKVKLLEEQVAESCKRKYSNSLREVSLQTEDIIQGSDETNLKICPTCELHAGVQHEVSIDEMNINMLFKDEETGTESEEKIQEGLVDVSVQTDEDSLKNSDKEIEDIRCSFEKEIKELKDEHNIKLKSLECNNEILQESNLCLTEKLSAANKVVEELKEKLLISIENVDDLRRQLEEMKSSEIKPIREFVDSSSQCEMMENTFELEQKIKELQSENDDLLVKLSNRSEELNLAKEEIHALKENHIKELKESNSGWEFKIEELKLEKETLNSIISNKDEELRMLTSELKETKNKLEESELDLKTYIKDNESYIDLLTSEKEELQNWIKTKEEEMNNLNVIVEKELIKLKTDSELKIEEIKKMYEVEINNLKNENDGLCEQIESIRNMYETEVLKFVNLIANEKIKNSSEHTETPVKKDRNESYEEEKNGTIPGECISKIKLERDSIVQMFNSGLIETSISITENVKSENISEASTLIQESNSNEIMSLVPVRSNGKYSDETIGNYNLHTVDEENMQLKINSESAMIEFVNEFAKEMLRENIMNPDELKTCTNVFYSLLNKYLLLLEMYSRLKQEFEEYKINEEKERFDIVNRTVRCLDTLCSQLEVSGSSLNLSNNSSFMSFHEGIPSSTIMEEDYTEMEISAINNVTMSKDPLALTQDITLKTPMKTPFKSAKKINPFPFRTPLRSVSKAVKTPLRPESVKKPILRTPASARPEKFSSDTQLIQLKNSIVTKDKELTELKELYNRKIGSTEGVIQETLENFGLLEKRIAKLETLYQDLQSERENLMKESAGLKESLTKSSEEITDIRNKLVVEIISLNPELEGTFSEVSVTDLLTIFIHTIMESCKKMPAELSDKLMSEVEALTEKNEMYENKIFEAGKEMNLLKEINTALMEEKERIEKTILDRNEEIKNLMEETCELKTLKSKMKGMEERLIENDSMLQTEIYLKENALKDLQKLKMFFEDVEKENSCFKEKIEQSDRAMLELKAELMLAKKEQMNNEMKEHELMKEIDQLKCILSDAEGRNKDLQSMIDNFEEEISSIKSKNKYKTCQLELLNNKITGAENLIQERDQIIHELKEKIAEVEEKLESKSREFSDFNVKYQNSLVKIEELGQTIDGYKESVNEEIVTLKNKLIAADDDLSAKLGIIQELSVQLEDTKEKLTVSTDALNSNKAETERLEKGIREVEETVENVIAQLEMELGELKNESLTQDGEVKLIDDEKALDVSKYVATTIVTTELPKTIVEKVNKLFILHNQQVERLKQELKNSEEASQNLKTELDKIIAKNAETCKSESFKKPEIGIPLKTPPVPKRNRTGDSPSFISRRLEKLEDLNDLLTGTLQKIIRALDIPFEDNFFSVGRYASSEAQIMKYISTLNFNKGATSKGNDFTNEEVVELSKVVKELQNTVSVVAKHLGLPDENVNGQLIVSQIDNMLADVKKDFLDRIDILRQDNQHLDDDNSLLQTELKKLMEQNNANQTKLNALAKSEGLLKAEVEVLKEEINKLQLKNKVNRKNDLWNRKLDKLEEMHQNLVDLMKKMLELTGMENVAKLNLLTARQFEVESKKVWDHFSDWVRSKRKEVEELKTQMKELDEECESYSKVIIEARQETERVWENCRGEVKDLKLRIAELQEENKALLSENKRLVDRVKSLENSGDLKDWAEYGAKESEELKKQNIALQSRIKDLEDSLSQARKQIEELDEECESYAKVIKETQRESLLCEETKNEIKALKEEVEKMEKEKKCLEKDKEMLLEKIQILESSDHRKTGTTDRGKKGDKEVKELKRTVALREMKILELEQLNEKNIIHKSQIKYLENSLAVLKDQLAQEELRNQKLQREVDELSLNSQKRKGSEDLELLHQLRARDSLGMTAIHQIDDKEKLQKLEKDNRMLKEICRSRYNEIKRLETENQNLKGHERTTKNSNQMDSPIRTRYCSSRFKKH